MRRTTLLFLLPLVVAANVIRPVEVATAACGGSQPHETRVAARRVATDNDYATIELAAKAVGAPLHVNSVVMIMVFPTFVDARIAASRTACTVRGVATLPDLSLTWTPSLPARWTNSRFVAATTRSIIVELQTQGTWHAYRATSPSRLHWIAGT